MHSSWPLAPFPFQLQPLLCIPPHLCCFLLVDTPSHNNPRAEATQRTVRTILILLMDLPLKGEKGSLGDPSTLEAGKQAQSGSEYIWLTFGFPLLSSFSFSFF